MTAVRWADGALRFVDQTRLPHEEIYIDATDYRVVAEAIRRLQIRGAPAIGVASAYALVLAVNDKHILTSQQVTAEFYSAVDYLSNTRPTAVNLYTALDRMRQVFDRTNQRDVEVIRTQLLSEAHLICAEDITACLKIGEYGADLFTRGSSFLTHCNAGALATAGSGTALAVITTAAKQNKVLRVYVDETRPLLQGARLTTWELLKEGIDTVLITDSTAGVVMQRREVDAVIVGADRIAANGDTANKIGTYTLAVLAERHGIPFYVAAPTSTIDLRTETGKDIPIEERNEEEVTHIGGRRVAAEGVRVFAPAFDVTPHQIISAIITEAGVLKPPFNEAIVALRDQSRLSLKAIR